MKLLNKLDQSAYNEFSILLRIDHENILRCYEYFHHTIGDQDYTCVITEYCQVYCLKIKNSN